MFKMIVKAIRANKSGVYDNILSAKDREFLSQNILSASWYPFDIYKRAFNALAEVMAKDNTDTWIQWGRMEGEATMTTIYKATIVDGDPHMAMEKFKRFFKLMYDFGELVIERISDKEMTITWKDFDPDFKVLYYVGIGWVERFLELCGARDLKSQFLTKSWEGAKETKIQVLWK
jgi:hypothetical protein